MVRPVLSIITRQSIWKRPVTTAVHRTLPRNVNKPILCTPCMNHYDMRFSTSGFTEKSFTRITNALTSRKLEFSERKVLQCPVDLMYYIVADIGKYCEFVPWCKKSHVFLDKGNIKRAKLEVGFGKITEKYNSTVTCVEPHLVKAVCTDGMLFNSLLCIWRFAPGKKSNTCVIDFQVSFEFRSLLYSQLANVVFNEIVKTMVDAFESRAAEIKRVRKDEVTEAVKHTLP